MKKPELPDRIKATLTIELDFAKDDQPRISGVLEEIIGNLWLSSSGNGSCTAQSHYSYKLESNLPKQPMTMDRLFDLMDSVAEPGEATARERIAESMHPDYDKAVDWWETLNEAQREWLISKFAALKLVTKVWEAHKQMDFSDRMMFEALK